MPLFLRAGKCKGKTFFRRPPASAEAGKLARYLKSPYRANFAGLRRGPEASEMMKQVV
ncbi:hypothetical protein T231_14170 [Tannerella sp. oral taxon BU063 isolate Cell 6/7/9]|uniref:Uncharacterized protein n=3 Tax=Tannerella serpentiformis TaxID=712710 RepID=W2CP03_9BACT|nr:hypothetical protein N425_13880 [Tannerella sp. oral taxon BU063 isolate Cell 2]ETK08147.1 hypothetical protein T231_14170 [Tannerella sp. oral taxon BU063 isolate Cell 6/7/9]ETK12976.1 hypothetical protein T235_06220 [Tannerella sp. oral taxon BU063 isolate Cell 8/11]